VKSIHDDLSTLDLGIHEARDLAQNRPDVFAQRYTLVAVHAAIGLDCILVVGYSPKKKTN